MKITKFLCLSIVLLFVFAKCKDDPPIDPNSFYIRCKVDGQTYIPDNCANCTTCDMYGDTVLILGANRGYEALVIGIIDTSNIGQKLYILNESLSHGATYKNSTNINDKYITNAAHTGQLNITKLDKPGRIIEGNFSFTAYNAYQNKTVSVTDGVFRLKF